jgi:hypothetical protein
MPRKAAALPTSSAEATPIALITRKPERDLIAATRAGVSLP